MTSEEFRDVIGHFASGVTVITVRHDGQPFGTTASAVSSLSLEPPMLLVCMNKQSATGQAIHAARRFAVNILGEDHADLAVAFARKEADKFAGVSVIDGEDGVPLLADALARLECTTVEEVTGGTHWVFLAEVERASARPGAPLAYFRGSFGRLQLAEDEEALRELRARVIHRTLPIGKPLDLDVLASTSGTPRGAIYHALAKLSGEGVVYRDSTGAFVVPPLTKDVVDDAVRARFGIIAGAVALTVGRLSANDLNQLRGLLVAARAAEAAPVHEWIAARDALVERIVTLSRSNALLDAFHRVNVPAMFTTLQETQPRREIAFDREAFYSESANLVAALERRDAEAAGAAVQQLLELSNQSTAEIFHGHLSF